MMKPMTSFIPTPNVCEDDMTLNLTAYGMGLGLVLVGWMAGLVVSYVFSISRNVGRMG